MHVPQKLSSLQRKGPVNLGLCGSWTSRSQKIDNHYALSASWFPSGQGASAKWGISWHCDVPSVRGPVLGFSRGTDWPDAPDPVALSDTVVGRAALGWGMHWVMYEALGSGQSSWHNCFESIWPLAFGQSPSWCPSGQGLLLATVGSPDGHGVCPTLWMCAQQYEISG